MYGQFLPQPKALYEIIPAIAQNKCLDASQSKNNLNKLIIYDRNSGANQRFGIQLVESNKYAFFCSLHNGTIEVHHSQAKNGASIECNQPNNTPNEKWDLIPVEKGQFQGKGYYIRSFCGKCMDVCQGRTSNSTPIIQYDFNGGNNQIWLIKQVS